MGSKKMNNKRQVGKGAILMIALLLVSSAVLRVGTGAGPAIAQAVTGAQTSVPMPDQTVQPSASADPATTVSEPRNRAEFGTLLDAIREREKVMFEEERRMKMRKKALEVAGREIEKRLLSLEEMEANLRETLSLADGAAEGDLAQLTTVYENMKAKDAAALFETMAPPFAAGFLGRMRPDSAAAIMAGLTPETAYTISVILAGRNASAPKS